MICYLSIIAMSGIEFNFALEDTKSTNINNIIKYYTVVNVVLKGTTKKMSRLEKFVFKEN